jgi:hypothetical protein
VLTSDYTSTTGRAAGHRLHGSTRRRHRPLRLRLHTSPALTFPDAPRGLEFQPRRHAAGGRSSDRPNLHGSASTPPPIVPGRGATHRVVLGVVPARPEKSAIGLCLGRQSGTTPDTARHKKSIRPHSVGPLSAGPFRARALEFYSQPPYAPYSMLSPALVVGAAWPI